MQLEVKEGFACLLARTQQACRNNPRKKHSVLFVKKSLAESEVSHEKMAAYFQWRCNTGMQAKLLNLDAGSHKILANGGLLASYKLVQHCIGKKNTQICTGQLFVAFNTEFKISQWQFCVQRSEFVSTKVLGPKTTEILEVAKGYKESQCGNESSGDRPELQEKIKNSYNHNLAPIMTFQVPRSNVSMSSPKNENNFTASLEKTYRNSDSMATCGRINNFKTLKRSLPNDGLEMDLHPGQQATRQRLEMNTGNNNNNNAMSSLPVEKADLRHRLVQRDTKHTSLAQSDHNGSQQSGCMSQQRQMSPVVLPRMVSYCSEGGFTGAIKFPVNEHQPQGIADLP